MTDTSKLEAVINKIADTGEAALWRQLVEIPLSNLKEKETKLREILQRLIEEAGEEKITEKLIHITQEIPEYPVLEVMQQVIKVSAGLRQEQKQTVSQLRQMLSELSTPIIRIWTDMLLVAMIGNIDSQRAQDIAEKLLNRVSSARAKVVIVDVTGVPMIDTLVGGFLIEMFNAIKLLGAEVILTGIKPEVAHTLVKLGVDFRMVSIARDLEDALRRGIAITMEEASKRRHLALTLAGSKAYENSEEVS